MSDERPAARVGDPIAHSNAMNGLLTGLVVGLAVGVLVGATIATGGGALAIMAGVGAGMGLTSFGALSGKYIGEASMGDPCGNFITGSPNVMVNGRPATLTLVATATCDEHSGTPPLATGAATVLINGKPAGRIGEKVGCSALSIAPASLNVMIGGPSAADPAVVVTPEVPDWAVTGLQVLGVAGAIMAFPYAIATVGVAATIGGGAGGFAGAAALGAASHALGKAMGLSETGVRSLEVAGGFLGGLVGGGAATRGIVGLRPSTPVIGSATPGSPLSQAVTDEIVALPKGSRPDPSTYLTQDQIDAHLAPFNESGAVKFTPQTTIDKYGTLGPPGGSYTIPRSELDGLIVETGGDVGAIEGKLGLPPGSLANGDMVAAHIEPGDLQGLRMPSGNELGANDQWLPGGYTSGGVPEAVVDLPKGQPYTPLTFGK